MRKSTFTFIPVLFLPIAVGVISAFLTSKNMDLYKDLVKPPLSPPSIVFPIAWTILYILMGTASYLSLTEAKTMQQSLYANTWYLLQLAMNFLWSIFFFNLKLYLFSFFWLLVMYIAVIICTMHYYRIDKRAGWLMLPYNLWLAFAAYLNLSIVIMN